MVRGHEPESVYRQDYGSGRGEGEGHGYGGLCDGCGLGRRGCDEGARCEGDGGGGQDGGGDLEGLMAERRE